MEDGQKTSWGEQQPDQGGKGKGGGGKGRGGKGGRGKGAKGKEGKGFCCGSFSGEKKRPFFSTRGVDDGCFERGPICMAAMDELNGGWSLPMGPRVR